MDEAFLLRQPVVISLKDLSQSSVPYERLEEAFGPSSLGILLVKDLPAQYPSLRLKLLSYSSYLANLPPNELESLTYPEAKYLSGWSHGKEALKTGSYDTQKGSYYVNCAFYQDGQADDTKDAVRSSNFPEFTAANRWPAEHLIPGFRETFEELCSLIIETAVLVARACDSYAMTHIDGYEPGYLERVVKTSRVTKARLLHYFPPEPRPYAATDSHLPTASTDPSSPSKAGAFTKPPHKDTEGDEDDDDDDSWCATHIDHGCLTGLTSALYIDEAANPPYIPPPPDAHSPTAPTAHAPPLPFLSQPPSTTTGLYIHARDSTTTKITIPPDCLAFQTGEALQLITRGAFRAVPHFVRAGGHTAGPETEVKMRVARNTLAVFTQPNLDEIVDREKGLNFGEFSREVVGRFG